MDVLAPLLDAPADLEAEQALLGAMLADQVARDGAASVLRPEHFADPLHGRIFGAIVGLAARGSPVHPMTVRAALADDDLNAGGGPEYLVRLVAGSVAIDGGSAEFFATRIADLHRRRTIIEHAELVAARARRCAGDDGDGQLDAALSALTTAAQDGRAGAARSQLDIVQAHTLADVTVPRRRWLVADWVPSGQVTLLSGDGGIGKSLLALQLMVAVSSGTPWIGLDVERAGAFGLFAEDDDGELHRRLIDVCNAAGVVVAELQDLAWRSAVVDPCELVEVDSSGAIVPTSYFRRLERTVVDLGSRLVVLDAATNLFGGDEIRRRHVNAFLVLLRQLAIRIDGAIVLLAHPSVQGMQTKSGMSGSTHWNNGVRSRLYFRSGSDAAEGDEEADDTDVRTLARMKANHAAAGGTIKVRWDAGAFRPVAAPDFVDRIESDGKADRVFLRLLGEAAALGQNVSPTPTSNNFGPTLFGKSSARDGVTKRAFEGAMHRLVKAGSVVIETYGKPSEPRKRLVPK